MSGSQVRPGRGCSMGPRSLAHPGRRRPTTGQPQADIRRRSWADSPASRVRCNPGTGCCPSYPTAPVPMCRAPEARALRLPSPETGWVVWLIYVKCSSGHRAGFLSRLDRSTANALERSRCGNGTDRL